MKQLDKLFHEERKWRRKADVVAKPFLKKAHLVHLKWVKLYRRLRYNGTK